MSWLKNVGLIALKVVGMWAGFAPLVETAAPATKPVVDGLGRILNLIVTVEQVFVAAFGINAKTGSQKLTAATPFVAQIIQQSELLAGRKIKDEVKFTKAVTAITSGFADVLNSVSE